MEFEGNTFSNSSIWAHSSQTIKKKIGPKVHLLNHSGKFGWHFFTFVDFAVFPPSKNWDLPRFASRKSPLLNSI